MVSSFYFFSRSFFAEDDRCPVFIFATSYIFDVLFSTIFKYRWQDSGPGTISSKLLFGHFFVVVRSSGVRSHVWFWRASKIHSYFGTDRAFFR